MQQISNQYFGDRFSRFKYFPEKFEWSEDIHKKTAQVYTIFARFN